MKFVGYNEKNFRGKCIALKAYIKKDERSWEASTL